MKTRTITLDIPVDKIQDVINQIDKYLEEQAPKVWEPKYPVITEICVVDNFSKLHGLSMSTHVTNKEQANDLSKLLRRTARLHCYASEHGYLREWSDDIDNYYVAYESEWIALNSGFISYEGAIWMTQEGAEATADALNSGELVL